MSELKVYSQCYDGTDGLFYLKSEADRYIAELKETIAQLEDDVAFWRSDARRRYSKGRLHDRYKRCLAMAKWCRTSARYDESVGAIKYRDWYWKWFKRWLALADEFKETK